MRDRIELRTREAVAHCLVRRLTVPRIDFEAERPLADAHMDVLAIDRVGDAHIVEIKRRAPEPRTNAIQRNGASMFVSSLAASRGATEDEESARKIVSEEGLIDPSRPGRIGVIEIVEMASDVGANVRIRAGRFQDAVYDVTTQFTGSREANIPFGG